MFFRVTNTFKDCVIKVTSGEKVLLERKKRVVLPGEMETLILTKTILAQAEEEIVVSLEV